MKKYTRECVIITIFIGFLLAGCGKKSSEQPITQVQVSSEGIANEAYFEWDGNLICGLSEEGKRQTSIVIPKKCEGFIGLFSLKMKIRLNMYFLKVKEILI